TKEIITTQADLTRVIPTDSKGNPTSDSKDSITDMLPGLEPGSYYLIVRTNITLSIRENINDSLKMANNICPSDNPFTVTLPEIVIGSRTEDTLTREGVKYYQITVPDTSGVSLRIQLDRKYTKNSKSDTGTFNEMYLKYGSMPTLSNYDKSFNNPYSPKQEIIVPNTLPGIYYLMVKNNYQDADIQDITIDASLLGFELLYIDQQKGGNGGELTIKMTGTGLDYGVKPKLIKSGSGINKTISAKATYYTDATELYATFDLRGADQGNYDAVLVLDMSRYEFTYDSLYVSEIDSKISVPDSMYLVPDSLVKALPGIFTVETSNNRGYLEYKNIPEDVRGGRGFESSMEITNISNNDMIAPLYMLKVGASDLWGPIKTKLPGEDSYTAGYKKFLILAEEGPAGIIRSGGRGSIRIYSTAPPANETIRFDMMKIQDSRFEFDFNRELSNSGFDRYNPEWIEAIYKLEQEVGNSWEGYNRAMASTAGDNFIYNVNKYYLVEELLLQKLSRNYSLANYVEVKSDGNISKVDFDNLNNQLKENNQYFTDANNISKSDVDAERYGEWMADFLLRGAIAKLLTKGCVEGALFLEWYYSGGNPFGTEPVELSSLNQHAVTSKAKYKRSFQVVLDEYKSELKKSAEEKIFFWENAALPLDIKDNFKISHPIFEGGGYDRLTGAFHGMRGTTSVRIVEYNKIPCCKKVKYSFKIDFEFFDNYEFDQYSEHISAARLIYQYRLGQLGNHAAYEWDKHYGNAHPFDNKLSIKNQIIEFTIEE
ncbi:TPA: hypothetical protein DCR49_10680, partial [Candidatus Delongbacteria bacterium]|nr:hypothetical protein [Candidatus Delongbacteria bacterium]